MPLPVERLHAVLDNIQTHLPGAIGGEADITHHIRLVGMTRAVVTATVEPPMVEVRLITGRKPTAERQRVLTTWGERLTEPRATDSQAAPGMRVDSIQTYAMTPEAAASLHVSDTTQRLENEHHVGIDESTFVECAIAEVVADMARQSGSHDAVAQPAQAA
jgi:hypothetical protein